MSRELPGPDCRQARRLADEQVDHALAPADEAQLHTHLDGCDACRSHTEGLHAVVGLLRAAALPAAAPVDLSERLSAIAGPHSDEPLWMSTTGTGTLPSVRGRRRRRALTGSVAVIAAMGMLFTLGLLAAPPMPEVSDAPVTASMEHDLTIGVGPGAQAVNVVLASAQGGRMSPTTHVERPQLMTSMDWEPLDAGQALELLGQGLDPTGAYSGVQRVTLAGTSDYVVADVRVAQTPGRPISVSVFDQQGRSINSGLLPATTGEPELPPAAALFRIAPGGQIAGRATVLLEAKRSDRSLVARWWIAPELGLVMWSESFDSAGRLVRSAGFTSLKLDSEGAAAQDQLPLQLSSAPAVTTATRPMCTGGFNCADELAGFKLVQISSDSPERPSVVHAVYEKDGVCVTVLQRRGRLVHSSAKPYGISADRQVVAWQSGAIVYTVTTNAGPSVAQQVAGGLPHDGPVGTGIGHRAWAGLNRLVGR